MRGVVVVAAALLLSLASSGCFVAKEDPQTQEASASGTVSGGSSGTKTATKSGSASATGTTAAGGGNSAPTVNITAAPTNGSAPLNVTFSLTGSDADGDNLTWVLALDSGNIANGTGLPALVNHTFAEAGNYTATVSVHDGTANATANVTIVVSAASAPPPAAATEDDWVVFNADGTCDAKGEINLFGEYVHERGDPPGTGYVAGGGTWIYEESNDIAGLQVGGAGESAEYQACLNPDFLVF